MLATEGNRFDVVPKIFVWFVLACIGWRLHVNFGGVFWLDEGFVSSWLCQSYSLIGLVLARSVVVVWLFVLVFTT